MADRKGPKRADGTSQKKGCYIRQFHQCAQCLHELVQFGGSVIGQSPESYARLSIGFTKWGIQVWCVRHEVNIVHFDFLGQKMDMIPDDMPLGDEPAPLSQWQVASILNNVNKRFDDGMELHHGVNVNEAEKLAKQLMGAFENELEDKDKTEGPAKPPTSLN